MYGRCGIVSRKTGYSGMRITVGHRPKSAHVARLATHSTQRSVLLAGQEMRMCLRQSNYHRLCKNAESSKWLQALVSETQLCDRVVALKWSDQKGKCQRRRSSSGFRRGSISLWCGYILIWTTKTDPLCRCFGVLFVESMILACVGSKTSPWIDGSNNHKTSNITVTPIYAINAYRTYS